MLSGVVVVTKVGMMCERVGLFQHALENYTDLADIKRVITNSHLLNEEFVVRFFSELSPEDGLEVLEELIKNNPRANLKLCVRIAATYTTEMTPKKLIEIFKGVKIADALYYYLQAVVDSSDDPEVHFEYIVAAVKLEQFHEVERVTRLSNYYDPQKVKKLLMDAKLKDPRPLVNVCDRFGYIEDMVTYMVKNNMLKFIEAFVQRVNPVSTLSIFLRFQFPRVSPYPTQRLALNPPNPPTDHISLDCPLLPLFSPFFIFLALMTVPFVRSNTTLSSLPCLAVLLLFSSLRCYPVRFRWGGSSWFSTLFGSPPARTRVSLSSSFFFRPARIGLLGVVLVPARLVASPLCVCAIFTLRFQLVLDSRGLVVSFPALLLFRFVLLSPVFLRNFFSFFFPFAYCGWSCGCLGCGFGACSTQMRTPKVVGVLLDLKAAQEVYLMKLILSVKNMVPVGELVNEIEKRGKLKMLHNFLESKIADGSTDVEVHSGVAKVYIESNINAEHFLLTNPYYDSRLVGKFCEKRNPYLAFIAYRRGLCDDELFAVTNDNSLFKEQARYVVDRENADLWARVLDSKNPFRKLVVEQITSTALPQTKEPEKIAAAVKAFMVANQPEVLMDLLEKLVVDTSGTAFRRNKNLQNLLILTAIKSERERVMEYINRLDNFDAGDVANIAIGAELYEEAYAIYQKFDRQDDAIDVLINHIKDFDRAAEYAAKADRAEVWSLLGRSMVESGVIAEGVKCLMRAKDPTHYVLVIESSREHASDDDYNVVVKYLMVVRKRIDDLKLVDTEIVYGLCRCGKLMEVEEFICKRHEADLEDVAERCFDEEMWPAAKLLFSLTKNWSRLAEVHIKLGEYPEAVECAKKANRLPIWKIVCFGCVRAKEFRLAKTCGIPLIVETRELPEVVPYYEKRGHFNELIELLDSGLNHERAHIGLFTELGVLYTKYREEEVEDYLKMWWKRSHVPRLVSACEQAYLWKEAAYLYFQYNEFDNAARTMIDHAPTAWNSDTFKDAMTRVGSMETMYRAIQFYIDSYPILLLDLMFLLINRCEATRAISIIRSASREKYGDLGLLPMVKEYLLKVQPVNLREVNDAVNGVLLAEEDIPGLDASIDEFDNFDMLPLAKKLESHRLVEVRRISAKAYRKVGKWEKALDISMKDKLYGDCIEAVKISKDVELCEQLATKFLQEQQRECFSALLYACYDFFKPDSAMELAWRHTARDFAMPYMIQALSEVGNKLIRLEEERDAKKEIETRRRKEQEAENNDDPSILLYGLQSANTTAVPMIQAAPTYNAPQLTWQQQQPTTYNTFMPTAPS